MSAATRVIYWNITGVVLMYVMLTVMLAVFGYGLWRRVRLWRAGRPERRLDRPGERVRELLRHAVLQIRLARLPVAGFFHILFSWGFVILFIGTVVVMIESDFRIPIMHGWFYLIFQSFILDLFGVLAIVGVITAWVRRKGFKPRALARVAERPSMLDDSVFLAHFVVILWTGLLIEGARIAATGDPWGPWSPFGYLHGKALAAVLSPAGLTLTHRGLWWFHLAVSFSFLAYLPYSKLAHILTAPVSIYFHDQKPNGELTLVDLEAEEPRLGAATLADFTWKDLADLDACTECGRCQENCPAYIVGKVLNPKKVILDLQHHLHDRGPALAEAAWNGEPRGEQPLESELVGPVVAPDAIWACTTCRACMEACPVYIEHVPKIMEMRRHSVMLQGEFPPELNQTFKNLERQGNPWGVGAHQRTKWAEGLDIPLIADSPEAEYLFWPGCSGAFDQRAQKYVRALVQLLKMAGVSFAILGNEEKCTGDAARRMGNEMLWQQLATENIETLKAYGVKKIITHCPHCFNTFANDYRQMGLEVEVIHHAELLDRLVKEGRLKPAGRVETEVAYHDSCYLGRYAGIFEPPRELLRAIPGVTVKEMDRHGSLAMCCGAGGGRMWMEEDPDRRVNTERARQALATGAATVATNCPFCMTMMTDGVAAQDPDERVRVRDIAEILLESVQRISE